MLVQTVKPHVLHANRVHAIGDVFEVSEVVFESLISEGAVRPYVGPLPTPEAPSPLPPVEPSPKRRGRPRKAETETATLDKLIAEAESR